MMSDVFSAHQHQTGFAYIGRIRIKAFSVRGTAGAVARLDIFDTVVAPTTATYGQTAKVVTVTSVAHGLVTGDRVGIAFDDGTGGAANSGNYTVTVTGDDTFTIPMLNSISITAGAVCRYVPAPINPGGGWLMTIEADAGDIYNNYYLLPDFGILACQGIYSDMDGVISTNYWLG
jgi:hypothetical protein